MPWKTAVRLIYAILTRRKLSFRQESIQAVKDYLPGLEVSGREYIPTGNGCVIAINHYTRTGFGSWWLTLSVSSTMLVDVHWITAAAWRKPAWLEPATHWAFTRMAQVYGFTSMPPMPPQAGETNERAAAIREVIMYARENPSAVIAISPEGGDEEHGVLRSPFPGTGRFMLHLARLGFPFLPTGIFEKEERVCVHFGQPFCLDVPSGISHEDCDRYASDIVMKAIARQLPVNLRGAWQ